MVKDKVRGAVSLHKHIPRLKKLDKKIHWGTDKETHKGGDFFKAET